MNLKHYFSTLLILLIMLCSSNIKANEQEILLITSIKTPKMYKKAYKPWAKLHLDLEKIFLKKFKNSDFKLKVVHFADVHDIYRLFKDHNPYAIFFLGHMGKNYNLGKQRDGVSSPPRIVDFNKTDIVPVFAHIPLSVHWFALVGCYSHHSIDYFRDSLFQHQVGLHILSFQKKMNATTALKKSIKHFLRSHLISTQMINERPFYSPTIAHSRDKIEKEFPQVSIKLKLKRIVPKLSSETIVPATQILMGNKLISVFPSYKNDKSKPYIQTKSIRILVNKNCIDPTINKQCFKIVAKSGIEKKLGQQIELGEFKISLSKSPDELNNYAWIPFMGNNRPGYTGSKIYTLQAQ